MTSAALRLAMRRVRFRRELVLATRRAEASDARTTEQPVVNAFAAAAVTPRAQRLADD